MCIRDSCNTSCASVPVHSPAARRCGGFAAVGSAVSSSRTAARRTAANAGSVTLPATGRGCVDRLVCVKTLQTISSARLGPACVMYRPRSSEARAKPRATNNVDYIRTTSLGPAAGSGRDAPPPRRGRETRDDSMINTESGVMQQRQKPTTKRRLASFR